ncbi:multicomponent Na+:H+ antiporter subunit F [Halalkaliarchaeum desulfuricum]|uniref:Multicomponent Na+:H+ antiporter subunit F n=1 Tax=Halalkaliarchaeum desulfuricum TaxID=2055893 RepID=A0A343TIH8_9EURY|nr:cation:proton antiporter [Halalkaliarchaeum desulfuricum]AUX08900.1 multicomponent Na+:H+ antiporter subunit F [Halalkaliarchaeum desulfuricum]
MSELAETVMLGAAGLVILMALVVFYRVATGPTTQDRLIGVNVIGTSTVIVIVFIAAGLGRPEYIDIALVYALLNFLLSLAIARFTYHEGRVE